MNRRTWDFMLTLVGVLLTVALLVAGGLLTWGSSFANSTVHKQLAQQEIYFPPKSAFAHPVAGTEITPSMIGTVSKYAGKQLLTGQEAEVYADDFIAVHLKEIGGGKTYSQLSAESMADPSNTALANQVETLFKGTTLRGLLLEGYAFSIFGTIATIAEICCWILAGLMLILTLLGFAHYRKTPADVPFPKTGE
jgi:hypothetical protein